MIFLVITATISGMKAQMPIELHGVLVLKASSKFVAKIHVNFDPSTDGGCPDDFHHFHKSDYLLPQSLTFL